MINDGNKIYYQLKTFTLKPENIEKPLFLINYCVYDGLKFIGSKECFECQYRDHEEDRIQGRNNESNWINCKIGASNLQNFKGSIHKKQN